MEIQQKRNTISLQMSSPKHMDIKVNSNVMPFNCESPKHNSSKAFFSNAYQKLSSSPNTLNKMGLNTYSVSPAKKNSHLVKIMDGETVKTTQWNNYSNANVNVNNTILKGSPNSHKSEMNFMNNLNTENIKDVLNNINNINKNMNEVNNKSSSLYNTNSSFDHKLIGHHTSEQTPSEYFIKKSVKNHFENKTKDKNVSQLSYQLSKVSSQSSTNTNDTKHKINNHHSEEKGDLNTNENPTSDVKLSKPINNNYKSLDTEAIADIVFKKQEVDEAEKMHTNAKTAEKIELQKSLYSCQLSLSPKEKMLEGGMMKTSSSSLSFSPKKSSLTREDFESTKVIKENARKMLLSQNEPHQPKVKKVNRSVKFSGENEECPFKRFEAPVSVTTSPIFLVNSTIKPFLETRCNVATFTEFKQRMIVKKPILIEKIGLLIEESEKSNGRLANFVKNADIKKEHGVFKSRPSHVPYGPSSTPYPLFSSGEKDKVRVVIQVQNLAYQKEITIRYTFNNWKTSKDVKATYLNSLNVTSYISKKFHDSTSIYKNASTRERNTTGIDDSAESKIVSQSVDRFVADIEIPSYIMDFMDYDHDFFDRANPLSYTNSDEDDLFIKDKRRFSQSLGEEWDNDIVNKCTLKFAACYRVNDQEYWENNNSMNYTVDIHRVLYIPTKKVYIRSRTPEIIKSRMVNFADAFYHSPMDVKKEYHLKSILRKSPTPTTTKTTMKPTTTATTTTTSTSTSTSTTNDESTPTEGKTSPKVKINQNSMAEVSHSERTAVDQKVIEKIEHREKCIRETIQKEFEGTAFFNQIGINPTILNTIINSNRVSTRNNILKMIMYYQRKAGIASPMFIPIEKETSTAVKVEGKN